MPQWGHLSGEVGPYDDAEDVVGLGHQVEEDEVAVDQVVEAARRRPVQRKVHDGLNIGWDLKKATCAQILVPKCVCSIL